MRHNEKGNPNLQSNMVFETLWIHQETIHKPPDFKFGRWSNFSKTIVGTDEPMKAFAMHVKCVTVWQHWQNASNVYAEVHGKTFLTK